MNSTAKLFMSGRSQAVRLPKEFRFEGTEVRVSKVGDKVIITQGDFKGDRTSELDHRRLARIRQRCRSVNY